MDFVDWILIFFALLNLLIIGSLSIVKAYYQRKTYQIQQAILKESREYWNSWKLRSQNIALDVKDEIKKEEIVNEERKESKRTKTGNRRNRNKTSKT